MLTLVCGATLAGPAVGASIRLGTGDTLKGIRWKGFGGKTATAKGSSRIRPSADSARALAGSTMPAPWPPLT